MYLIVVAVGDTQNLGDFFKGFFVDLHLKALAFYWPAHHFLLFYRALPRQPGTSARTDKPETYYITRQVCLTLPSCRASEWARPTPHPSGCRVKP